MRQYGGVPDGAQDCAIQRTVEDCNLAAGLLVRLFASQLVVGCAEKTIQQEFLAMVDPTLGRVIASMRANETARKESDRVNPMTSQGSQNAGSLNTWQRQPRKRRSLTYQ